MMQPTPAEELRLDQMGVDDTLRRRLRDLLQVDQGCVTRRRGMKVASTDGVWRKPWRQLFWGGHNTACCVEQSLLELGFYLEFAPGSNEPAVNDPARPLLVHEDTVQHPESELGMSNSARGN